MRAKLLEGPDTEPVSLAEAKAQLNGSSQDDYITSLILACRVAVERYLNRALITQTWEVFFDNWCSQMKLPYPVLQEIESVKYFDGNGEEQTLDIDDFLWIVSTAEPAFLRQKYNAVLPILEIGRPDAIKVTMVAGYGDAATDVPEPIRLGIKGMLTNYYEHRGDVIVGAVQKIPNHIVDLLHPYRIYEF